MISTQLNAAVKAWTLADSIYGKRNVALRWKNKIRFSLLACTRSKDSMEWFSQLEDPGMHPFIAKFPGLIFKPMRAYLSIRWDVSQRKKVIWDTYQLIRKYPAFQNALLDSNGTVIARYQLENYGELSITLCYHHVIFKEGELMVILKNNSLNKEIYKMAFSFQQMPDGDFTCYIGCIQGGGADKNDEIKAATKAMYGLRPCAFMIFIAREIISAMGIRTTKLLGVGNSIHPFKKKHLIHLPSVHQIDFDYNSFWLESNGEPGKDGWFSLPIKTERREKHEMKSNKRAMYNRRYAMMDTFAEQIHDAIGTPRQN